MMTNQTSETPLSQGNQPNFGQRVARSIRAFFSLLLRVVLVLILGVLVGMGVFFGIREIYEGSTRLAVSNAERLDVLEADLPQLGDELDDRLDRIVDRISNIETYRDSLGEIISAFESDLAAVVDQVESRGDGFDDILSNQTENQSRLDALETAVANLEATIVVQETAIADLAGMVEELPEPTLSPADKLAQEAKWLSAMEKVNRARTYLAEEEYALASTDIESALEILRPLMEEAADFQRETLTVWVETLEKAENNLPDFPVLAHENLEIVWEMMSKGVPAQESGTEETSSPTMTPTPIPVPTRTPYYTPTPTPSQG
jgi:nitrogen fixation/metabolism regulation signal transduction histidine kinase